MELQKITEENRKSKRIIEVMAEDLLTVNKKIKVALSLAHVFALTLKVTLVLALALYHILIAFVLVKVYVSSSQTDAPFSKDTDKSEVRLIF